MYCKENDEKSNVGCETSFRCAHLFYNEQRATCFSAVKRRSWEKFTKVKKKKEKKRQVALVLNKVDWTFLSSSKHRFLGQFNWLFCLLQNINYVESKHCFQTIVLLGYIFQLENKVCEHLLFVVKINCCNCCGNWKSLRTNILFLLLRENKSIMPKCWKIWTSLFPR